MMKQAGMMTFKDKSKKNKKNKIQKEEKTKKRGRGRPRKRRVSERDEDESIYDSESEQKKQKKQKTSQTTSQVTKTNGNSKKNKITKVLTGDAKYENKKYVDRMKNSCINFKTNDLFSNEELAKICEALGNNVDYDTLRCNVIEYLNQYFACITGEGPFTIVQKQWDSERKIGYLVDLPRSSDFADLLKPNNPCFTIKNPRGDNQVTITFEGQTNNISLKDGEAMEDQFESQTHKINAVNIWNNCIYRKTYVKRVFNPRPSHHHLASKPNELNCFIGLPFSDEECKRAYLDVRTRFNLDYIIEHFILNIICDGNKNTLELLQSIHAYKLKYPWEKDQWRKVLYGSMGAGKSIFFSEILKPQFAPYYKLVQNIKDLLGEYDAMKENTLIFVMDENLNPQTPAQEAALRSILTSDEVRVNKKFKDQKNIPNYIDIWAAANPPFPLHLDTGDRRTWVIQVSNKRVVFPDVKDAFGNIIPDQKNEENKQFWTNIINMLRENNYSVVKAYQWYLMNEFKGTAFKRGMHAPSSNIKRKIIEKNSDEVQEFWQQCLIRGEHCRWEELEDTKPEWISKFTDRTGREIDPELARPKESWICEVSREDLYKKFRQFYPTSMITEVSFYKKSQDVVKITNKKTVFKVDEETGKTFTVEEPLSHRFGYKKKIKLPNGSIAETICKDPVVYYKLAPHSEQLEHYLMTFKIDLRKEYEMLKFERSTVEDQDGNGNEPSIYYTTQVNSQRIQGEEPFKKKRSYNKKNNGNNNQEPKKRGRKKKNQEQTNLISRGQDTISLDKEQIIDLFLKVASQDAKLVETVMKRIKTDSGEESNPIIVSEEKKKQQEQRQQQEQQQQQQQQQDSGLFISDSTNNNNIRVVEIPTQSPPSSLDKHIIIEDYDPLSLQYEQNNNNNNNSTNNNNNNNNNVRVVDHDEFEHAMVDYQEYDHEQFVPKVIN